MPEILQCFDVTTGKPVYSKRLEGISSTWASPVADSEGHLFFANAGKSFVIATGPECRILSINDLDDANHPSAAVSDGKLFLMGMKKLYCIGQKN